MKAEKRGMEEREKKSEKEEYQRIFISSRRPCERVVYGKGEEERGGSQEEKNPIPSDFLVRTLSKASLVYFLH